MKESAVCLKIKKWLNCQPKSFYFKTHGNGFQLPGIPDLIGLTDGRFIAVEVKVPGKEWNTSKAQDALIELINKCGGIAFVASSIDTVEDRLMAEGIL